MEKLLKSRAAAAARTTANKPQAIVGQYVGLRDAVPTHMTPEVLCNEAAAQEPREVENGGQVR